MMASVLNSVTERRLRPIYEQLDNGNNKKAFNEAEKVLKKQKDLIAAKVLKTIALHRLGREEEAFALSEDIVIEEPTDENSLQGLCLYFKEIHRTELISTIYEAAVKHFPSNEEYLTHLFMSYIRQENFQQMQRVAMNLYKQHPKNPYLFWGIMAIVLQAQSASDKKLAKTMYLPLAEKMIEKHIDKGKLEAEAEVRLYLLILDLLGKHEKVLEVLNGDLGRKLTSELRGHSSAILTTEEKAESWDKVNVKYKHLLKENPDVWNYALGYLESFFNLLNSGWLPDESQQKEEDESLPSLPDYTVDQARKFITDLVEAENIRNEQRKRGPYLLRLEMLLRLKMRSDNQDLISQIGSSAQLLLEYALDFSMKPCCFQDLTVYFSLLSQEDVDRFLTLLHKQQATFTYSGMNGDCNEELQAEMNRKKEKEIQRHIFTIEAARYLGKHESLSNEEKVTLAKDCVKRHEDGICYSVDRPVSDGFVVDAYCLLATRLLIDVYLDTNDHIWLLRGASVLEYGLKRSPYNYEMKFFLIKIYSTLGLLTSCDSIYNSLEIKHVQHDTLGYVICRNIASHGHFHRASQLFQMARNFYFSNNKDLVECLIACFRNGTFYKISELFVYRRQVRNSFQAIITRIENVLLNFFTHGNIDQKLIKLLSKVDTKRVEYDCLIDNRDFSVISDINPVSKRLCDDVIVRSFKEEKDYLKFRELLLLCMRALVIKIPNNQQPNGCTTIDQASSLNLDSLIDELDALCTKGASSPASYLFHGPMSSRLHLCFEAKYPRLMLLLFRYCRSVCNASEENFQDLSESSNDLSKVYDVIDEFLKTCCDGVLSNRYSDEARDVEDSVLSETIPCNLLNIKTGVVERLVICAEMFSFSAMLLMSMHSVVATLKTNLQRRRRKSKRKQTAPPAFIKQYQDAVEKMMQVGEKLSEAVKQISADSKRIGEGIKIEKDEDEGSLKSSVLAEALENKLKITESEDQNGSEEKTSEEVETKARSTANEIRAINELASGKCQHVTNGEHTHCCEKDQKVSRRKEVEGIFDNVLHSASESFLTSSKQLQLVLDGKMKALRDFKV